MKISAFCRVAFLASVVSCIAVPAFAHDDHYTPPEPCPAPSPLAGASLLGLGVLVAGGFMLRRFNRDATATA